MDNAGTVPEGVRVRRRARVAEIARLAGVGTATVDRVLNDRPHVSALTRQRVRQAKAAIEAGARAAARSRPWRLKVFLPRDAGPSTDYLGRCLEDIGAEGSATVECVFTKKMEPAVLARKLRACAGQRVDAVAFQALEDPRVRDAVEYLADRDIPAAALLSDLDSGALVGYVGMDNRAAGRTAGYLLGRLAHRAGPVAVVWGGQLYRAHEDREMGFRASLRRDFAHLRVVGTYSGHDDSDGNHRAVLALVEAEPDLVGIYNVGGGNDGVVRALHDAGAIGEILFIGHNLSPATREYLLEGSMDVVLHQNLRRAARQVADVLMAHLEHRRLQPPALPVEIITRENVPGGSYG